MRIAATPTGANDPAVRARIGAGRPAGRWGSMGLDGVGWSGSVWNPARPIDSAKVPFGLITLRSSGARFRPLPRQLMGGPLPNAPLMPEFHLRRLRQSTSRSLLDRRLRDALRRAANRRVISAISTSGAPIMCRVASSGETIARIAPISISAGAARAARSDSGDHKRAQAESTGARRRPDDVGHGNPADGPFVRGYGYEPRAVGK